MALKPRPVVSVCRGKTLQVSAPEGKSPSPSKREASLEPAQIINSNAHGGLRVRSRPEDTRILIRCSSHSKKNGSPIDPKGEPGREMAGPSWEEVGDEERLTRTASCAFQGETDGWHFLATWQVGPAVANATSLSHAQRHTHSAKGLPQRCASPRLAHAQTRALGLSAGQSSRSLPGPETQAGPQSQSAQGTALNPAL